MKIKVSIVARVLLGLCYFGFGIMGMFFMSKMTPPPMPEAATGFMKGMMGTGYFFPLLKITEISGGLLLLTGFAAPLGLVLLAPVTLNIFLFHAFLTPGPTELILPSIMTFLHVIAIAGYWKMYRPLFTKG